MKLIETAKAPLPAGHYSQAVVAQGLIFVSGLLPLIPEQGQFIPEGIIAQTEQIFKNLSAILQAADSDIHNLVSVQIFVSSIELWQDVNAIYKKILGEHKPARVVIPCGPLHYGALLEISAVAEKAG